MRSHTSLGDTVSLTFSFLGVCLVGFGTRVECCRHVHPALPRALEQGSELLPSLVIITRWTGSEKPPIAVHHRASNPAKEASQGTGKYCWALASVWEFSLDLYECKVTLGKSSQGARSGLLHHFYIYNCNVNCHGVHLYMTFSRQLMV